MGPVPAAGSGRCADAGGDAAMASERGLAGATEGGAPLHVPARRAPTSTAAKRRDPGTGRRSVLDITTTGTGDHAGRMTGCRAGRSRLALRPGFYASMLPPEDRRDENRKGSQDQRDHDPVPADGPSDVCVMCVPRPFRSTNHCRHGVPVHVAHRQDVMGTLVVDFVPHTHRRDVPWVLVRRNGRGMHQASSGRGSHCRRRHAGPARYADRRRRSSPAWVSSGAGSDPGDRPRRGRPLGSRHRSSQSARSPR